MRINHNISALKANSQLTRNDNALSKSLEKLTSGLKINRAADDAAGMAISQKMKTQIAALNRASANGSDGISVIQTAEGALTEVENMAQRMRQLAVQAANGTNTVEDKQAIQSEIDALNDEILRISETTEFNTKALLNGDIDRKTYSNNPKVQVVKVSDEVETSDYGVKVTQDARQAVIFTRPMAGNSSGKISEDQAGKININGVEVAIEEGMTYDEALNAIRSTCDSCGITCYAVERGAKPQYEVELAGSAGYETVQADYSSNQSLVFVSDGYGESEEITLFCENGELATLFGLGTDKLTAKGIDAKAEIEVSNSGFKSTATVSANGNMITVSDLSGFEMTIEVEPFMVGTDIRDTRVSGTVGGWANGVKAPEEELKATLTVLSAGPLSLHIGANEYQTMSVRIPKVTPKTLGIDNINVATGDGAQKAISKLDDAITEISSIRAKLGAYQNRLEHAITSLDVTGENMTEALSRIEDTDMAAEMASYTQYSVLTQAGTAMLAQANQRPQNILSLLQS